ncbi:4204_t:CDS:2, partial [Ambispora leptoticha]
EDLPTAISTRIQNIFNRLPLANNQLPESQRNNIDNWPLDLTINPTDNKKLGATLKAIESTLIILSHITRSQTTYNKFEKEGLIPFGIANILQTILITVQIFLQSEGISQSEYESHSTIISYIEAIKQQNILNKSHTTRPEIQLAE